MSLVEATGGVVLLDQRRGRYFSLNPTGAFVVRALLDGATIRQAAQKLMDRYQVSPEQAEADVTSLLDSLRGAKLIT